MTTAPNPAPNPQVPEPVPLEVAIDHPEKVGHPDGVPHDIVGLLMLGCVVLAAAMTAAYFVVGLGLAIAVAVIGVVVLFRNLPRRARRERRTEAVDEAAHHGHDAHRP